MVSGCAWATGRAARSKGSKFLRVDWLREFDESVATIANSSDQITAAADAESPELDGEVPLSVDSIARIQQSAIRHLGIADAGLSAGAIRIETKAVPAKTSDDADQTDFLNSFFVGDLGEVSEKVGTGTLGAGLRTYLRSGQAVDTAERIDVRRDLDRVYSAVEPRLIPAGRWPGPLHHPAALSQQLAVNQMRDQLRNAGGIFAVNGPPGTGKTTLLRDVIASVVVDRADALAELKSPDEAFVKTGTWETDGYTSCQPLDTNVDRPRARYRLVE